ncbi:penicillin-binding protein 1A [Acidihalobacter ferrooxydans]|uniref:Penicillin-binding protein 1A n=1 Tax=Acidihalobacter ferrooxydans TaxID=1765967 RepID=A0A1P8UES0_9GAMM|nr:PBP1A family penicillin-binding protein [Acidihalobacter ferrooxydans]APZ42335.1 penicillin-binding protein [Acidihalobacter ferrooxydans]
MTRKAAKAKRKPRRWGRIFLGVLLAGLIFAGGVGGWLYLQWRSLPSVTALRHWTPSVPLRIYDKNGNLLATVGPELHDRVTLNNTPLQLGNAFVAAENKYFWSHNPLYFPVDYPSILRAAWVDLTHLAPAQGASTITEQVARNFYLSPKKTITRKVREILLAYKLAMHLNRREILTLYLNKIYFGYGAYGVGAAARVYYGVAADQLTLPQMAMLAAMPAAPNYYNPLTHPKLARWRRDYVIKRMLVDGYINSTEAARAAAAPLTATYHTQGNNTAPYVAKWITKWLVSRFGAGRTFREGLKVYTTINARLQKAADRSVAIGLENYAMGQDSLDPQQYRGPIAHLNAQQLKQALAGARPPQLPNTNPINLRWGIVLSVKPNAVKVDMENTQTVTLQGKGLSWAQQAGGPHWPLKRGDLIWMRRYVDPGKPPSTVAWHTALWKTPQGARPWQLAQVPKVQGALVSMNNSTGAIDALVGGFSYALSHYDRALYAYRQPGSAFKPFVYAAALDGPELLASGKTDYLTQVSLIPNTPLSIKLPNGKVYKPTNYDMTFTKQPIPVWKDLADSKNVPSVRILMHVGIPYAIRYATHFGFPKSQLPPVPSLVLGAADVTPLQMTRGYAVFSNGGFLPHPYFVTKVVNDKGQSLSLKGCALCVVDNPPPHVITSGVAYLLTTMMQRVISEGTGVAARSLGHHLAGKTGTTNDQKNAWFVGYGRHVVTTVWVGQDNNKPMVKWAAGAREALPIWIHYMHAALVGVPSLPFFRPPGIVQASVNPKTGTLSDSGGQVFDFLSGFLPPAQSPLASGSTLAPSTTTTIPASVTTSAPSPQPFLQQYSNGLLSGGVK